jgi:solute carrier family 35 protein C2
VEEWYHKRRVHRFMVRVCSRFKCTHLDICANRFFFATMISLYNKWMFSKEHFGFPYPLLVTTFHMLVQFLLAASLRYIWPQHFRPDRSPGRQDYGWVPLRTPQL